MRILIAEDDESAHLLFEATLSKSGHEVVVAVDSEDAARWLESQYALHIAARLDDAKDVGCGVVRARATAGGRGRPYLLRLTERSEKKDLTQWPAAAADDGLTQPLDLNELGARLRVAKRRRSRERLGTRSCWSACLQKPRSHGSVEFPEFAIHDLIHSQYQHD